MQFVEFGDIPFHHRRQTVKRLMERPLWDTSPAQQQATMRAFIDHDILTAAHVGAQPSVLTPASNLLYINADDLVGIIDDYNMPRNGRKRIKPESIPRMCVTVMRLIYDVQAGNRVSSKLLRLRPLYKRKAITSDACRIIVDSPPALNIAMRYIKHVIAEQLRYRFDSIHAYHERLSRQRDQPNVAVLFLDFSKAFDSVDRRKLIQVMNDMGLGNFANFVAIFDKCSYDGAYAKRVGIPQGMSISTLMFSMLVRSIINKHAVSDLDFMDYVDDISIVIHDPEALLQVFDTLIQAFRECGLLLNLDKCKLLVQGFECSAALLAFQNAWKFQRIDAKNVERYLGRYYTSLDPVRNWLEVCLHVNQDVVQFFSALAEVRDHDVSLKLSVVRKFGWLCRLYGRTGDAEHDEVVLSDIVNMFETYITMIPERYRPQIDFQSRSHDVEHEDFAYVE